MAEIYKVLVDKLREHSRLSGDALAGLKRLSHQTRDLSANEDLIRQGDASNVSVLVVRGILGRYHQLPDGSRQYLSFHMKGGLPDVQALFLDQMDHAVCALGSAAVALIPHKELLQTLEHHPGVALAIWRETLVDAAIFREAITNNSARPPMARLAHIFSELLYRAKMSKLTDHDRMELPISLPQWAEALGMGVATVNRALANLRASHAVDFRNGVLMVRDWKQLQQLAHFNPAYLHFRKESCPDMARRQAGI